MKDAVQAKLRLWLRRQAMGIDDRNQANALDDKSEKRLESVEPNLVKVAHRAAQLTSQAFTIVQGKRTQAEQDRLFQQGRTTPGPIVTWTRRSRHVDGTAIDFAVIVDGQLAWKPIHLYVEIGRTFKQAACELGIPILWGGDWDTKDWGHIELAGRARSLVRLPALSRLPIR